MRYSIDNNFGLTGSGRFVTGKIIAAAFLLLFNRCEKFVTVPPPKTQLINSTVFSSDETANAAIAGIYSEMMSTEDFPSLYITLYGGLSADEFTNYSSNPFQGQFFANAINPSNTNLSSLWGNAYQYIYAANAVLEGLTNNNAVSALYNKQLTGEALFIRAFCNFYLVNFFGDVPLVVTTSYTINQVDPRTSRTAIYDQIIADLKSAEDSLTEDYSFAQGSRIRPNKFTATALLARTYLYTGDWQDAVTESSAIINNSNVYVLDSDLNQVFILNNSEAIWQLEPVQPDLNTYDGYAFVLTGDPSVAFGQVALTESFYNSFENGDMRKSAWTGVYFDGTDSFYFPYKYKIQSAPTVQEALTVFRLAEQYLIRAEALGQENNIAAALNDLNVVRNRAGLPSITTADQSSLIPLIVKERRSELFCEFAHRWLDLKRMGTIDQILSAEKPEWKATDALYPIPQSEIQIDPNLTQNPGY
jgi:starch-binding outer membrane protein, SusD/RagB family